MKASEWFRGSEGYADGPGEEMFEEGGGDCEEKVRSGQGLAGGDRGGRAAGAETGGGPTLDLVNICSSFLRWGADGKS